MARPVCSRQMPGPMCLHTSGLPKHTLTSGGSRLCRASAGALGPQLRARAAGRSTPRGPARAPVRVESAGGATELRSDPLSGGKEYTREVLLAFEQADAGFGPRVFTGASLAVGLLGSLPVSVGDVVRAHGSSEALGVLAANVGLAALICLFIASNVKGRTEKLDRLAKELVLGDLKVVSTDRFGNDKLLTLRELRASKRVALVYGATEKLQRDLAAAQVYRSRLAASNILVIPLPSDAPGARIKPPECTTFPAKSKRWLVWPAPGGGFNFDEYFQALLGGSAENVGKGAYITLGLDGRVRGSGAGSPNWDVLLSTFPQQLLDRAGMEVSKDSGSQSAKPEPKAEDQPEEAVAALSELHRRFYAALDAGDVAGMSALWAAGDAGCADITSYVERGAQLDGWDVVQREDRRPVGMKVTDPDFLVGPDGREGWCTSIETVAGGSTLLATQRMERSDAGEWHLVGHRTIPYGKDIIAKVCLICDGRGCVALPAKAVASTESMRTFKLK
mmetsp:Transcript_27475/g.71297  ORF Transcript_27475/g.71297 Transcript_27475/m.71297 type:complete len:505 (-) Transcript_27475:209-1723(-)